ncbi:MAG: PEP-CTERM sorting domain-containing protein [Bryobacteraceae bacterium]
MKYIESKFRRSHTRAVMAGLMGLWLASGTAEAATVFFTDSLSFGAAAPVPLSVQTFEGVPAGTAVPQGTPFQGITYNSNLGGLGLEVSNVFATTSGTNYLGATDDQEFLSGHELTFSFGPLAAFGLFIIASPGDVLANDFQLVAPGGSMFNAGTPERVLSDGREVFFLGVTNTDAFNGAQLLSFGDPDDPFFGFQIDDIATGAVPEPASYALIGAGLALLGLARRFSGSRGKHNNVISNAHVEKEGN